MSGKDLTVQNMEVIIIERQVFDALVLRVKTIEEKAELLCRRYDDLGLKRWLDNQEVCEILKISQRTLQEYRNNGVLPFSCIKHKMFYKPDDVEKLLRSALYVNYKFADR